MSTAGQSAAMSSHASSSASTASPYLSACIHDNKCSWRMTTPYVSTGSRTAGKSHCRQCLCVSVLEAVETGLTCSHRLPLLYPVSVGAVSVMNGVLRCRNTLMCHPACCFIRYDVRYPPRSRNPPRTPAPPVLFRVDECTIDRGSNRLLRIFQHGDLRC